MLKTIKLLFLFVILVSLFIPKVNSQNEINSPYSGYGVGLLTNSTNGTMASMGGVGYAMQNPYYINFKNPASYVAFDSLSFIADASLSMISGKLRTTTLVQRTSFARANYLMMGLPVAKNWRTSAGIVPFSDMGYKIYDAYDDYTYTYNGEGGLMQLYWGNAFKLWKGLSVGINTSYMFGTLSSIRYVEFNGENFYNTRIARSIYVDGIYISAGLQYFTTIKDNHKLGFGVVYENSAYIWARENLLINYYEDAYSSTDNYDTLINKTDTKGRLKLPQTIGAGISYCYKDKLLIGIDLSWQNWSKYELMGESDSLKDALTGSVGLQYTADPQSTKYINNVSFRAGAKYSTGYFTIHNSPISEYAFTFGVGLPLKSFTTKSSINIMVEFGQMGTLKNDLILQNYFKFSLNFILQEKWYQRVKLE
jgi:hypothetical protein